VRRRWTLAAALVLAAALAASLLLRGGKPAHLPGPGAVAPGETGSVDLYFADADGRRLAIERRAIAPGTPEETIRAVAQELILGPRDAALTPTLPPSAAVRAVFLRDGIATVDFTSPVSTAHPGGSWNEVLSVYSVVNSVAANVAGVERVQILVEGRESETLAGHMVLDRPLSPQPRLLDGNL
jgi:germination protein M